VVDLDIGTVAFLAAAGLLAGAINAVAGGGSLISFPALLLAGYPAVTANATNIVAVLPGYVGGSIGYRRELRGQGHRVRALTITSAAGAIVGAVLLVEVPARTFEAIAPFLILVACGALAAQPLVDRASREPHRRGSEHRSVTLHVLVFAAAVYGGYFGAALGIMLLAVLGLRIDDDLQRLNALKGLLSLVIAAVSAVYLAVFGSVVAAATAAVAVGSLVGGRVGVGLARRISGAVLRGVVVAYGVAAAAALLVT
jgi:uncharacterized protein